MSLIDSYSLARYDLNDQNFKCEGTLMRDKKKMKNSIILMGCLMVVGCTNMPTPSSQITGSYVSGLRYESFSCKKLSAEVESLARRENQLTIAQEQRIKSSQTQAFWWGYGQGDGIEASELANVKGEKEAVRKAMGANGCKG